MMTRISTIKFAVMVMLMSSMLGPSAQANGPSGISTFAHTVRRNSAEAKKRVSTEKFVRTELFFGSGREDGPDVTEAEFRLFLDKKVTPGFPHGLTVLIGKGQYCCDGGGAIIQEASFMLILLYPVDALKESSEKIEKIREDYKTAFKQQSVLRVDDRRPVRVSF